MLLHCYKAGIKGYLINESDNNESKINGSEKMDDGKIIDLYWERSENAITETDKKYRNFCMYIANNILHDISDSEECISDTYLAAWNAMPPERPAYLSAFIGKIVKNLSLKRFRYNNSEKRNKEAVTSIEEISECISVESEAEKNIDLHETAAEISNFLREQSQEKRVVFLRRYWFFDSYPAIAERCGMSEDNVRVILMRMRKSLKTYLEKRGITV